jgi:WD40 repeat protein
LILDNHAARILAVAFSPDGKKLATASSDKSAKVWDANTGKELYQLSGHSDMVLAITFSPDGKQIATASADHTVILWDANSGKPSGNFQAHSKAVYAVAFSPDGKRLATGSADRTAKLWDVASRRELKTFPEPGHGESGHTDEVHGITFSPDGMCLVTASYDGTAKVWDAAVEPAAAERTRLARLRNTPLRVLSLSDTSKTATAPPRITSVAYSPRSDRIATTSSDGLVKLWDASSGQLLTTLYGHSGDAIAVAFEPHGEAVATAGLDGLAKVWNISPGGELFSASPGTDILQTVTFSKDGRRIATGSTGGVAAIWDNSGAELHRLVGHLASIADVGFNPAVNRVATASEDKTVKVWDVTSGKMLQTLSGSAKFSSVAFSSDGTILAAGGDDGRVILWDAQTGRQLSILDAKSIVWSIAFSPDGKRLAVSSGQKALGKFQQDVPIVTIWDVTSRTALSPSLSGHDDAVYCVAFSHDGKRLATASRDGTAKLWDAESHQELMTFRDHTDSVTGVAFTPDDKRLATSGWDNSLRMWDVASGVAVLNLSLSSPVLKVAVSPDGKHLGAVSYNGSLGVYSATLEELTALASKLISRPMTDEECKKYLHVNKPCAETPAAAMQLVEQGNSLARAGNLDEAVKKLGEAKKKDKSLAFDPVRQVGQLRGGVLLAKGRNLAANEDRTGALECFRSALALDPDLRFDADEEARSLVALGRLKEGESLARRGLIKEAIVAYDEAQKVDSALVLGTSSLNMLCWYGSLWDHAGEVLPYCKQASDLAPLDWNVGDSLGVAYARTGRIAEALPYFIKFASRTPDKSYRQRRLDWITALLAGRNPLSQHEEIEWLLVN